MPIDSAPRRRLLSVLIGGGLVLALAGGPVLGVDPSPSPKVEKPEKAAKVKAPETPITVTGTVAATTDADGDTTYSLTAGGTTYTLEAGPSWWYGANHPLAAYVGKSVTVVGETAAGSMEIDVTTVEGKAVRATTGKPPWAGGPKSVGEKHPGWKSWHAAHPDGKLGKGLGTGSGRSTAPGQLKKAAAAAAVASASPAP
ncbi:MAG: hypothetical protein ABIP77_08340 [Candidatus Limnocylindrales bacterium]